MAMKERQIGAGAFKQRCLAIIDEVAKTHRPVTISKRGKPMARLVPLVKMTSRSVASSRASATGKAACS